MEQAGSERPPELSSETMASDALIRPTPWKALYASALTALSPGVLMGLLCGALIGGVGGRLSMLLLRLTSSDSLHGMETDDDFTIGSITGDTLFLVIATAFLGLLGGLVYMGVREWLPEHGRPILFGLLGGTVGGTVFIRPGGIDFTALEPLSLAVALFVFLPATYAATLSMLTERLLRSSNFRQSNWRWAGVIPLLLPILVTGPFGVGVLIIFALGVAMNRSGQLSRLLHSTSLMWVGRLAFTVALVVSGASLARDVSRVF